MMIEMTPVPAFLPLSLVLVSGCVGFRTPLDDAPVVDARIPCATGNFSMARAKPTVMLVLDRSASMATAMEATRNSPTRWSALATALSIVLPPVDSTMAIGALMFPAVTSGITAGMMECSVASKANVQPATGNVAALTRLMSTTSPGGATPTAMAIDTSARLVLGLRTAATARALVLATDGGPNCNSSLNAFTCRCVSATSPITKACSSVQECLDDTRTEETISEYQSQGLPTYVIGIQSEGDTQFSDVLNAMAIAGGRPQVGTAQSYYAVSSQTALNTALTTIRDQVSACTYLTTSVPDQNGSIVVSVDGIELTSDQWTWGNRSNGEIVLLGDTCQTTASEQYPSLTAAVECSGA
jgi:hypothetical protein